MLLAQKRSRADGASASDQRAGPASGPTRARRGAPGGGASPGPRPGCGRFCACGERQVRSGAAAAGPGLPARGRSSWRTRVRQRAGHLHPPIAANANAVAAAIVDRGERGEAGGRAAFMSARGASALSRPSPSVPESAAVALARAAAYGEWRRRPREVRRPRLDSDAAPRPSPRCERGGGCAAAEVGRCSAGPGIPVAAARVPQVEDGPSARPRARFPVALKAVGPTILHKTEVGGVRLDLANAAVATPPRCGRPRDRADRLPSTGNGADGVGCSRVSHGTRPRSFRIVYGAAARVVGRSRTSPFSSSSDGSRRGNAREVRGTALLRGFTGVGRRDRRRSEICSSALSAWSTSARDPRDRPRRSRFSSAESGSWTRGFASRGTRVPRFPQETPVL
jgi:hypothetical protein